MGFFFKNCGLFRRNSVFGHKNKCGHSAFPHICALCKKVLRRIACPFRATLTQDSDTLPSSRFLTPLPRDLRISSASPPFFCNYIISQKCEKVNNLWRNNATKQDDFFIFIKRALSIFALLIDNALCGVLKYYIIIDH